MDLNCDTNFYVNATEITRRILGMEIHYRTEHRYNTVYIQFFFLIELRSTHGTYRVMINKNIVN